MFVVTEHAKRDYRVGKRPARTHLGRHSDGLHHLLVGGTLDPCNPGVRGNAIRTLGDVGDRDAADNLLYGRGIHVRPGAPLAHLELRVFVEELLGHTDNLALEPGATPPRAHCPGSGFSHLSLVMT